MLVDVVPDDACVEKTNFAFSPTTESSDKQDTAITATESFEEGDGFDEEALSRDTATQSTDEDDHTQQSNEEPSIPIGRFYGLRRYIADKVDDYHERENRKRENARRMRKMLDQATTSMKVSFK